MTTIRVLRVVAKREGFRRAALVFGSQPRDIPLDALTVAQRAAITRDPMLLATEVEVEIADQAEVLADASNLGTGQASAIDPSAHAALKISAAGRKRK